MAKGGQGKGKAKGHSKNSSSSGGSGSSYSPPASIAYPSSTRRTVRATPSYRTPYATTRYERPISEPLSLPKSRKKTKIVRRVGTMGNTAYCMKCREKVEIKNPRMVVMRNGRPAISGTCPYCGTKVFKIGK